MKPHAKPWLINTLIFSLIVLIWVIAIWITLGTTIPEQTSLGDLSGLLFGAASVALFILSFLVAVLAISGWQSLKTTIDERVDTAVLKKLQDITSQLEKFYGELTGRQLSSLGFMVGELSHTFDSLEPTDLDRLEYCIQLCGEGYDKLRNIGASPGNILLALNNLVFYLSLRGRRSDSSFVLAKARELRKAGEELKRSHWLLTYCRAVLRYSSDPRERKEAEEIILDLMSSPIPENQRKEAKLYLASFRGERGA